MNVIDERFSSPGQLEYYMSDFKYIDFEHLMSPVQVFDTERGSCHDQAIFEYYELKKMGLEPRAFFMIAWLDNGRGGETHSFITYELGGKAYWFENAWLEYSGIHEFDSMEDLLDYVQDAFVERNRGKSIDIAEFAPEDHIVGEDLDEYVDICLNGPAGTTYEP